MADTALTSERASTTTTPNTVLLMQISLSPARLLVNAIRFPLADRCGKRRSPSAYPSVLRARPQLLEEVRRRLFRFDLNRVQAGEFIIDQLQPR